MDGLNRIEEKINTSKFIYNNENIWPIYRNVIGWQLAVDTFTLTDTKKTKNINKLNIIKFFLIDIFKFFCFFKRYDAVYFSSSDDYRTVDGQQINRLTNSFHAQKNYLRVLEIQSGNCIIKASTFDNIDYISSTSLLILRKLLAKLIWVRTIEADSIEEELRKNHVSLKSGLILKEYLASKVVYGWIYKLIKPKIVITTCYSHMYAIKFANDFKISTLEFQHGKIDGHFAYSIENKINPWFYPNSIALFGERDKKYLEKMHYISNTKNIHVVGNALVDYYCSKENNLIDTLRMEYTDIIAVTLQWTVFNEVIRYVKEQAKSNKNYCFILIPRNKEDLETYVIDEDNIKLFLDVNCYEIVTNCDYHMTVYSSCALETPSLGVKNILLNLEGMSRKSLGNIIDERSFYFLLEPNQNISDIVNQKNDLNRKKIMDMNRDIITIGYKNNIEILAKGFK